MDMEVDVEEETLRPWSDLPQELLELTMEMEVDVEEETLRPWSDLPQELLELIKKRTLFADQQNFPAVCKSWSSIGFFPPAKQLPWLIVCEQDWNPWSSCKLVDPTSKKTYSIDMKSIKDKKIKDFNTMKVHESKFGWLLISSQIPFSTTTTSLFLYSPFYKENDNVIELPVLNYTNISLATFTSNPLNEDCKFWTLTPHPQTNGIIISRYSHGDKTWCSNIYSFSTFSPAEVKCWTFSEGFFYGASSTAVGRLDLNQNVWARFLWPPSITWYNDGKLHIVKSDGDEQLFLIFERSERINKNTRHFVTYRLDLLMRIWKRVDMVGDRGVLFIGDGYNCVSKINEEPKGIISHRLYYCSGLQLKFCDVQDIKIQSYNCWGDYGLIATRECRKLLIDPPSLPLPKCK